MRHRRLTEAPLRVRVWRAIAIGFSFTALTLNVLAASFARRGMAEPRPSSASRAARSARSQASAPVAVRAGDAPAGPAAAQDDARAVTDLARRFSDAADGELPELATALAALGGVRARQALFTAVRSARPSAQAAALEALATLDVPDVREFMLERLKEREPLPAALNYFTDCQEPRALPMLERLAHEASAELRPSVLASLFAQGESATPVIARLLGADDELSDALLDTNPTSAQARRLLRQASVRRLRAGAITQGRVFDFLEQDLSVQARDALLEAAHDPASAARALTALANRGDRASSSALERLANDSDPSLAARATCTLRALNAGDGSRAHRSTRYYVQ